MIVFENDGEIDPRLISLIGVNVKESASAIGFFGTGLKYAVACLLRWGEEMTVQSGLAEFHFSAENTVIRGASFGVISMHSRGDALRLGFTTELGKQWEPWMVYRELWCNAHDEPAPNIYETDRAPSPREGVTRVIVKGDKIKSAHLERREFILEDRPLRIKTDGLEIYDCEGDRIFYRGIAVQKLDKPSLYTYNITSQIYLTEDRTAANWYTDPPIVKGITESGDVGLIDATLYAEESAMESRLDYGYAFSPCDVWTERAFAAASTRPLDVPLSVRNKFVKSAPVKVCPTCGKPMDEEAEIPF